MNPSFANREAHAQRQQASDAAFRAFQAKVRLAQDARRYKKINGKKTLPPVRASKGLECLYRKKMQCLIEEMDCSVRYWLAAAYKKNEPAVAELADEVTLAQDEVPALELRRAVRRLARRWQARFAEAAPELGRWFAKSVRARSQRQLHEILKKGGWTVELKMSPAQRDVFHASVAENVSLIRSIPQRYFARVEGHVMRSVQAGRDLHQLTKDLQKNYKVTRKQAILIARDQNNKINSAFTRVHQMELGLQSLWIHSHAGKTPRPTHLKNDGKPYDPAVGWLDPAINKRIWPGSEINCRCFSRSIVPGFS